jgi:stage II sporulation protein D
VGLSQWGTKAMAEQGKSYADILAHYYPGTQLQG